MKCDFCGANLTIDDEICPYCHTPNPHYAKHREDMRRYKKDYQSTKTNVYKTAGRASKKAVQIAILAVLGLLFLGSTVLNISAWSIERALLTHKVQKNLSAHIENLDNFIANEDWNSYAAYIEVNALYYSNNEKFDDYRYFQRMASDYNYIYEACMHLVDYKNISTEYAYYTPDSCLEQIANNLNDMYDFVRSDEYSAYYKVYQTHPDWCDAILTQTEELVQAYLHVDPQVIKSGEIRTLSKARLNALLERSYQQ